MLSAVRVARSACQLHSCGWAIIIIIAIISIARNDRRPCAVQAYYCIGAQGNEPTRGGSPLRCVVVGCKINKEAVYTLNRLSDRVQLL